jgi:hypothetical protein
MEGDVRQVHPTEAHLANLQSHTNSAAGNGIFARGETAAPAISVLAARLLMAMPQRRLPQLLKPAAAGIELSGTR